MKKTLLYTGIFLFASFFVVFICLNKKANTPFQEAGEDIGDYYKWEQKMLADPVTGKIPQNIRALELDYAATLPSDANLSIERLESLPWSSRGCWNIGGRTRAFAADVTNEAVMLAGTCSGGMWRSADSGKSWALVTPLAIQQGVSCLTQDVRTGHTSVWYYGSGEAIGASASGGNAYFLGNGVYRSVDNGQTWQSLTSTATNSNSFTSSWQSIWNVVSDPHAPDSLSIVYAAASGTLYRTTDSGRIWSLVLGNTSYPYSYYGDVQVSDSGIVYATMSSDGPHRGIWRSVDGVNFTNITPAGFPTSYNRIVIAVSKKDPNQVYFLANTPGFGVPDTNFQKQVEWNSLWKYKYVSGNGSGSGGMWFNLTANLPATGGLFDKYNSQQCYDMVIKVLPTDTSTIFIGGTDIFRSTTGFFDAMHTAHIGGYAIGATLPRVQVYPNHHPDQHVLFFSNSTPYIMYSGCDGGIFKTVNDTTASVSWSTLNNGYITTMFYTVASDHTRPGGQVLIGGAQDNNSLFNNSLLQTNPWTKPIFGDGSFCYIADSGKTFYYSSQEGKMFKVQMDTINGTLGNFTRIDPIGGKGYQFVNPYVIDPNNNYIMYLAGGKYIWRNNNLSGIALNNQWDSITTNWIKFPDSVAIAGTNITALAVSTVPANRIYYGTDNRHVYRIDSANIGTPTPRDITSLSGSNRFPVGSNPAYVSSIAVDPNNADNVIVVFSNYNCVPNNVYYSTNGGTSWTGVGGNIAASNGPSARWISIQHTSTGTIYWLGASTGLYATDTLMGSSTIWVQQGSATIGNTVCDMIDVRPSDGLIAVATHAHGIYTNNITATNQITATDNIAISHDNDINIYPNPFAERTSVSFSLPKEDVTQLTVFDENGKVIKQLNEGRLSAGKHILEVDLGNQACGIYFCHLQMGNVFITKRMVLVK
jgi:hypothetical protein